MLCWRSRRTLCWRVCACPRGPSQQVRPRWWWLSPVPPRGRSARPLVAGIPDSTSMEKLHHELWITHAVNVVFGPIAAAMLRAFGRDVPAGAQVIPDYLAMLIVIALALTALSLFVRSRLSVENPGSLQIALEDFVTGVPGPARRLRRPQGPQLPAAGRLDLRRDLAVEPRRAWCPGLMAPTSNLNVTLGCAHDGVGLLPLSRASRSRASSRT